MTVVCPDTPYARQMERSEPTVLWRLVVPQSLFGRLRVVSVPLNPDGTPSVAHGGDQSGAHPANGSRTRSPRLEQASTTRSASASGIWVGCRVRSGFGRPAATLGNLHFSMVADVVQGAECCARVVPRGNHEIWTQTALLRRT